MTQQSAHHIELAAFQKRNRLFAMFSMIAIASVVAVIVLTLIVIVEHWGIMTDRRLHRLALTWSSTPFYLWALWSLRTMFGDLARAGPRLQPTLARALARTGWGLLLGALTTLVTSPFVLAMAEPRGMAGGFATFSVPALTLGIVGLALIASAHVLRRGAALEVEAARLKAELGEFV